MPFFRLHKPVLEAARDAKVFEKRVETKQEKPFSSERLRRLQSILHALYRELEERRKGWANGKGKKET